MKPKIEQEWDVQCTNTKISKTIYVSRCRICLTSSMFTGLPST